MNGIKVNKIIVIIWYFVSPPFIFVIWIFSYIDYTPISYGKYQFNDGAQAFGWCIAVVSIIAVPAGAIHTLIKSPEITLWMVLLKLYFSYIFRE